MRKELKALSKETLIYGVSTVVGRFLYFLLVPFYVNTLHSTAEYGIVTSLYTYIGFLNVIYPLGLEGAFFRYGARAESEPFNAEREKPIFSGPFFLMLALALVGSLLLSVAAPWLTFPIFHDPKIDITPWLPMLTDILRLGAAILFFDTLNVLPFAVLRLEHKAVRFGVIRLIGIVVTLALNFWFVMGRHWGVVGIFYANVIASLLVTVLLLPTILSRLSFRINWESLKKQLAFGLTNVPANFSAMMVQVIDRPIVQAYLGLNMLGIYQANYRMGFIMMVFVGLFEYAWRPFFMRMSLENDAEARKIFSQVFTYFTTIALMSFLILSWGLPFLLSTPFHGVRLLRADYLVGLPIIPVVLAAYLFQGLYTNFMAGIYIKNRNRVLPWVTGFGAATNVMANVVLIPRCGIMGAALATLFAYIVMAGALYYESNKVYPISYEWKKIAELTVLVGGVYAIDHFVLGPLLINREAWRTLIRLGFILALMGWGVLRNR